MLSEEWCSRFMGDLLTYLLGNRYDIYCIRKVH